jgi:hypothetical protein
MRYSSEECFPANLRFLRMAALSPDFSRREREREREREHLTESNNYIRLKPEREFTLPRDPRFLLIPLIPFRLMMTFETNTRV